VVLTRSSTTRNVFAFFGLLGLMQSDR
jgi:hypothetical protein